MKNALLIFLFIGFYTSSIAQTKWQQYVDYEISVELDKENKLIHAHIRMEYKNNSPDTLNELYIHLWPNGYKNNSTALAKQYLDYSTTDFYFSDEEKKGYIDSLSFTVDKQKVSYTYYENNIDIAHIQLNKTLLPNESIIIETPFRVKVPSAEFSRLGEANNAYFISQWYPKPAVYDKNGWHPMPYLNAGEFYSEFGNFNVTITVPDNYIVAASGDLQTESEIAFLDSLSYLSKTNKLQKAKGKRTFKYHLENAHDFAWFADTTFIVRKKAFKLKSGKEITAWIFSPSLRVKDLWKSAPFYLERSTQFYSNMVSDYPYKTVTAVEGVLSAGGGMEYPTITLISEMENSLALENVIMHEVGHNWFYGMLGFNERDEPWLDEGINSFYEYLYMNKYHPSSNFGSLSKDKSYGQYISFLFTKSTQQKQAIDLKTMDYDLAMYFINAYYKSTFSWKYLRAFLGIESFDRCMKQFFQDFQYQHADSKDLQISFESTSGENLDWFFNNYIKQPDKLDFKIKKVITKNDSLIVYIKNKSSYAAPVMFSIEHNNSDDTECVSPAFEGTKRFSFENSKLPKSILINKKLSLPDNNSNNNSWHDNAIIKRSSNLGPFLLMSFQHIEDKQIGIFPIMAANYTNGYMLGMSLYNNLLFSRTFNFTISPLYSFKTHTINGFAKAEYLIPNNSALIQYAKFGIRLQSFSKSFENSENENYYASNSYFRIDFHPKKRSNTIFYYLEIGNKYIINDIHVWNSTINQNEKTQTSYFVNYLKWEYKQRRPINPWNVKLRLLQNMEILRSEVEASYFLTYNKKNKGLNMRLFYGQFLYSNPSEVDYRFRLDGTNTTNDFMYDYLFLGRNQTANLAAQQFVNEGAAFKVPSILGQTWDGIIAANLSTTLPGKIPIDLFIDLAKINGNKDIYYDAGVKLRLFKDLFEIYVPLAYSDQIKQVQQLNNLDGFWKQIRFTLRIEELNIKKIAYDYKRYLHLLQ